MLNGQFVEVLMSTAAVSKDFELIHKLSSELNLSVKQVGELLDIHPRTLQRRQESGRLEEAERLKAEMLEETFSHATTAFHDTKRAREWLLSEVAALGFERPVDMLKTIPGYERVKALLGHTPARQKARGREA